MKLENTSPERIAALAVAQRAYFGSGATLGEAFRREQLRRLGAALKKWEQPLCEALWQDLHKSEEEAVLTELSIVEGEIRNHLRHLHRWMRWKRRSTPLKMLPSRSRIVSEPLGCALIVAPWNYPVQLLLNPLVGAISAGCTAILKPSPYVPNVSLAIERMIAETFDERYISVVQGNREVNGRLLEERYDVIFFTGSPSLGRIVMRAAAEHLTPVVLELGGKSPCIVDCGADVDLAARRIVWGKTLNAGQTCIAPDYLMIYRPLQERFIEAFRREVRRMERGEAEEDIRADEEREAEERAEAEERERRERRRRSSTFWQLFSGTILVREGVSKYYPYMLTIAGMFFLSIMVMFWSLHLDMRYTRLERDVQKLRERSIRLQEQRYQRTTHSAIVEQLRARGIELYDPQAPGEIIEN